MVTDNWGFRKPHGDFKSMGLNSDGVRALGCVFRVVLLVFESTEGLPIFEAYYSVACTCLLDLGPLTTTKAVPRTLSQPATNSAVRVF